MLFARRVRPGPGRRRAIAVNVDDARPEAAGEVQPVDAFLEERVAAGHRFVVAPVVGGLQPPGERHEVREHHLADDTVGDELAQAHGQRLVMIVFPDKNHSSGAIPRRPHSFVIRHRQKRRLLNQHMLSRRQRPQRRGRGEIAAAPRSPPRRSTDRRWPPRSRHSSRRH